MSGARKDILPAGPLMKEHRLIEKMVGLIDKKMGQFSKDKKADVEFIKTAVDFMSTYADKCHHGKEEDILFSRLKDKDISSEHQQTMDKLLEDHKRARELVKALTLAAQKYKEGDDKALDDILARMKDLTELYPQHIETEDKKFFLPVMEYFSKEEKDQMLDEFYDFDREMIHQKYQEILDKYS